MSNEFLNNYPQDTCRSRPKELIVDNSTLSRPVDIQVISKPSTFPLDKIVFRTTKRIIDIFFSLIGTTLFFMFFPILGIIIKIDSKGSILFKQRRLGKDGKSFIMLKFRSMIEDAEKIKPSLLDRNEVDGPMFKIIDDPRLTRVGDFLRRTKLDELPQFWNILKGDMALIGPRPLAAEEMSLNAEWRESRLNIKPGLTGLWQVSSKDYRSFKEWVYWDTYYVENQSLALDMKIFVKTITMLGKYILNFKF